MHQIPGNRKRTRLNHYDYTTPGAYFITVCSHQHRCAFGKIADGRFSPNPWGRIIHSMWKALPDSYPAIELDYFQLMPNHLHGIIILSASKPDVSKLSLSTVVRQLKSFSSREINKRRGESKSPVWQRGFYDRVIRPEEDINDYRQYIIDNPLKWELDKLNPAGRRKGRTWSGPYD